MRSLQEQLIKKGLVMPRSREIDRKGTSTRDNPKEQLTDRELRELMGVNRDTFKRHRGSVRRR